MTPSRCIPAGIQYMYMNAYLRTASASLSTCIDSKYPLHKINYCSSYHDSIRLYPWCIDWCSFMLSACILSCVTLSNVSKYLPILSCILWYNWKEKYYEIFQNVLLELGVIFHTLQVFFIRHSWLTAPVKYCIVDPPFWPTECITNIHRLSMRPNKYVCFQ